MPQPCKICRHADREAIDAALIEGWPSLRAIGAQYGVSKDSLLRHYRAHIPDDAGDEDDGQGVEEPNRDGLSLAVTEKEPDEARQVSEVSEQKKEPVPPRLWTPEQWEEVGRQAAEIARAIQAELREQTMQDRAVEIIRQHRQNTGGA